MNFGNQNNDDFFFEEVERYKLSVDIDNKIATATSNDYNYLKQLYDNLVNENINNDKDIIIAIFDYDKNTNIDYFNSDHERC